MFGECKSVGRSDKTTQFVDLFILISNGIASVTLHLFSDLI